MAGVYIPWTAGVRPSPPVGGRTGVLPPLWDEARPSGKPGRGAYDDRSHSCVCFMLVWMRWNFSGTTKRVFAAYLFFKGDLSDIQQNLRVIILTYRMTTLGEDRGAGVVATGFRCAGAARPHAPVISSLKDIFGDLWGCWGDLSKRQLRLSWIRRKEMPDRVLLLPPLVGVGRLGVRGSLGM